MSWRSLIVRIACFALMSAWAGGFSVYGGVVVPTLHEAIGVPDTAAVTRQVTNWLNGIGAVTLTAWIAAPFLFRRSPGTERLRILRALLLAASFLLLVGLALLHLRMESILDSGLRPRFYPYHRAYLTASTAQWLVGLVLLAIGPGVPDSAD